MVAVHPVAPAAMQRAVFVAVLSLLFFLGMMFAYYIRGDIGYFLLSTAFLLVYLVMMFSIITHRKNTVELFERGLRVKGQAIPFGSIVSLDDSGRLSLAGGGKVQLVGSLLEHEKLISWVRGQIETR